MRWAAYTSSNQRWSWRTGRRGRRSTARGRSTGQVKIRSADSGPGAGHSSVESPVIHVAVPTPGGQDHNVPRWRRSAQGRRSMPVYVCPGAGDITADAATGVRVDDAARGGRGPPVHQLTEHRVEMDGGGARHVVVGEVPSGARVAVSPCPRVRPYRARPRSSRFCGIATPDDHASVGVVAASCDPGSASRPTSRRRPSPTHARFGLATIPAARPGP